MTNEICEIIKIQRNLFEKGRDYNQAFGDVFMIQIDNTIEQLMLPLIWCILDKIINNNE